MKTRTTLLIILLFSMLCLPALAAGTNGQGDMVARNGELAAFLGNEGGVYISGLGEAVNTTPARSLVFIDPYRILFFARENSASGVPSTRLICLNLDGFKESIVTDDALAACLDGEDVYYISARTPSQLMRVNLDTMKTETAFMAIEALERLYVGRDGIVITLQDGAGAYVRDAASSGFVPYSGNAAAEIAAYADFDVYLTDEGHLYAQTEGAPVLIDTSVRDWVVIGHTVYYLNGTNVQLKSYNVDSALWNVVLTLPVGMDAQLTSSSSALYMISTNNVVYTVNVTNGQLAPFVTLPAPNDYNVSAYRIEAVSGQLNIYGVNAEASQPTFTFVESTTQLVGDDPTRLTLLSAYSIVGESTVWDLLQPATQYTPLRQGSRGDAVSALQRPLYNAGYYDYHIDGIFGWRTERAVRLLQDDLGLAVTGVADENLQRIVLAGSLSPYNPYRALYRGDSGLRVTEMQEQLRDLGYLADDADGIFGPRTQSAVALFQYENGLNDNGSATAETLRKLFSSSARACSSYIDLRQGDSGYRVRELNRRLKQLYYLEGSIGSTYTSATAEAVRRFQNEAGLRQTGQATEAVQKALFSSRAPEYGGYITLRRGDENDRVLAMQRRLHSLGYYLNGQPDGYFGKLTYDAVRQFQRRAQLKVTGVADAATLQALYASDAPAYQEPIELTKPFIELVGEFPHDDNGIYHVPNYLDSLVIRWTADGAASYDVTLSSNGNTLFSQKNTTGEMASVTPRELSSNAVYTVTVVAHPLDTVNNGDTTANLSFVMISTPSEPDSGEVGVIGKLIVSPSTENESVTYSNGVYTITGSYLSFLWSADGNVSYYGYAFSDASGHRIYALDNAGMAQNVTLDAATFRIGQAYTLTVYAIPVHGTMDDAVSESITFIYAVATEPTTVPTQIPTAAPTQTPAETPTMAPTETPSTVVTATLTTEPTMTVVSDPTATPTAEPTATAEPIETATPEPSDTPQPETTSPSSTDTQQPAPNETDDSTTQPPQSTDAPSSGGITADVIDEYSEEDVIKQLQQRLMDLGWLDIEQPTGTYGDLTKGAVMDFQRYIHDNLDGDMDVDGYTGQQTINWLNRDDAPHKSGSSANTEKPVETVSPNETTTAPDTTAEPEAAPTDTPEPSAPSAEVINQVQSRLIALGWLDASQYTGAYDDATRLALADYQRYLNQINPGTALPEDGYPDEETLRWLNWDSAPQKPDVMPSPTDTTPTPTAEPEIEPTDSPDEILPNVPVEVSTPEPTEAPTPEPTEVPTPEPTEVPTPEPTEVPTPEPTEVPTPEPTEVPTPEPTEVPTPEPTEVPTPEPTEVPTPEPMEESTLDPADLYPMDNPDAWNDVMDATSDPEAIKVVQQRLLEWGWLDINVPYIEGHLDEVTVQAVVDFQQYMATFGKITVFTDPIDPKIDPETLKLLFNADDERYEKV